MRSNRAILYGAVSAGFILFAGLAYLIVGAVTGVVTPGLVQPPTASKPGDPDLTVGRGQPAQRQAVSEAGKRQPGPDTDQRARAHNIKATSASLDLAPDQRTRIFEIIDQASHPRVEKVDFELMIGAAVPRQTELAALARRGIRAS